MKSMFGSFIFLFALSSQAQIARSGFQAYQQLEIRNAIFSSCGPLTDFVQTFQSQETVEVDQGIIDTYYTTLIEGLKSNAGVLTPTVVEVRSSLAAGFDHKNQVWGLFSVDSVTCDLSK